jgi:hypothetical protein
LQVLTVCWLYNKCMLHRQQAPAILAINVSNLLTVSCGGIKALVRPHSILTLFPIWPDSEGTAARYRNPWSSGKVPLQCTYTRLLFLEGRSETATKIIISQLVFAFTGRNRFISIENVWSPYKNSKTTRRDAYLGLDLSIHVAQSIW